MQTGRLVRWQKQRWRRSLQMGSSSELFSVLELWQGLAQAPDKAQVEASGLLFGALESVSSPLVCALLQPIGMVTAHPHWGTGEALLEDQVEPVLLGVASFQSRDSPLELGHRPWILPGTE